MTRQAEIWQALQQIPMPPLAGALVVELVNLCDQIEASKAEEIEPIGDGA